MVENCFQVSLFCICGAVAAIVLKQHSREHSVVLTVFVSCAVIAASFGILSPVLDTVRDIFVSAGLDESYISIMLKAAAICLITEITRNVCTDSGESAMAAAAVFWGKISLTYLGLPLLRIITDMIRELIW